MNRKLLWILPLFIIILVYRFFWPIWYEEASPKAVDGVIDLRGWEMDRQDVIRLDGEWKLTSGITEEETVVDVPGGWDHVVSGEDKNTPFAYGTYRLELLLPQDTDGIFGLKVGIIRSAHRLFVNGEQVGQQGTPGISRETTDPSTIPHVAIFPLNGTRAVIEIEAANFHYASKGGLFEGLQFGKSESVLRNYNVVLMNEAIFAGLILLCGIYFISIYSSRPKNREFLYFGLFLFLYLVFWATHGHKMTFIRFSGISYEIQSKLQVLSSIGVHFVLFLFVRALYPIYARKWITRAITAAVCVGVLFFLITRVEVFSRYEAILMGFEAILFFYSFSVLMRGFFTFKNQSQHTLVGALCVLFNGVIHGLTFTGIIDNDSFPPIEILIFAVTMAHLISRQFFHALTREETLTGKLLRADKLRNEFLANTSHELRTPLHGILSRVQVLKDEGDLSKRQEERLDQIVSVGRRLSHMLDDIMDLSKLNEGTIQLNKGAIDLHTTADHVIEVMSYLTEGESVRFENRVDRNLPQVLADGHRLMQILFNLLHLSLKRSQSRIVHLDAKCATGSVEISVCDDGPMVLDESMYELNLAICRRLVELHGGSLTVKATEYGQTAFVFTLPLSLRNGSEGLRESTGREEWLRAEAVTTEIIEEEQTHYDNAANTGRALLVAADPEDRQVLSDLLAREGFAVTATSDGRWALKQLELRSDWDLAVLDVILPQWSGFDLCRSIRERHSFDELPILLMTTRSQPADLLAGYEAGANDYVPKPVDPSEFKARIQTLLKMKQSIREKLHMEMALIQAQINPHFLFNTLNTIASLGETDHERMREVLVEFGQYLRNSFDSRNLERFVPFMMEWELVQSYIYIEQARFGDRIHATFELPATTGFYIPPLSLQPIVENALRHGILKRFEGGTIHIAVVMFGNAVTVSVRDDGVGFAPGKADEILSGRYRSGIGLSNINRRLKLVYGSGLSIESEQGHGSIVSFTIPKVEVISHESNLD